MGPPEGSRVEGSWRVRSGLMASQLSPWSVERNTMLPVTYRTLESCGENLMGYVHWKRYFMSLAPQPV